MTENISVTAEPFFSGWVRLGKVQKIPVELGYGLAKLEILYKGLEILYIYKHFKKCQGWGGGRFGAMQIQI